MPDTPPEEDPAAASTLRDTPPSSSDDLKTDERVGFDIGDRYQRRSLLGVGGMGEVHLCADEIIGREVALKMIKPASRQSALAVKRFVREAKVQARLEHPAVVPVYDMGTSDDGTIWFTMKRIRGRTLDVIVHALAQGDATVTAEFSQRKLLAAFARVCLAVDYAHRQGVVHRDLKPGNVMLGDFGEVNVLDWGLAKIVDAPDDLALAAVTDLKPRPDDDSRRTQVGTLIGTPGYMAPEQARGMHDQVGPAADVYALGAILFEIVTREPLHGVSNSIGRITSTLDPKVSRRPSERGHAHVAPEIEEAIVRATKMEPGRRIASARELGDLVDRYLDGDRDVERRRELAAESLASARTMLETEGTAEGAMSRRAAALQQLGRAVALDPQSPEALGLLARVMVEPPAQMPADAEAAVERGSSEQRRAAARVGARRYLLWVAFIPFAIWMGIREWPVAIAIFAFVAASGFLAWWLSRAREVTERAMLVILATSSIALTCITAFFGTFVLVPAVAGTNCMYFSMFVRPGNRKWVLIAGVAAVTLPFLAEVAGLLPPAYAFTGEVIEVLPRVVGFPEAPTTITLFFVSVAAVALPAVIASGTRDALIRAEKRLILQAWHLGQLLPASVRPQLNPHAITSENIRPLRS